MAQTNIISVVPESTINLIDVLRIIKRNIVGVLVFSSAVTLAVGFYNYGIARPYYVAKAAMISSSKENFSMPGSMSQALSQVRGATNELLQYAKILETTNLAALVGSEVFSAGPEKVLGGLSVRVDGPVLELQFRSTTPEDAARVVAAYIKHLDSFLQSSFTEKARSNEVFIGARLKEAEGELRQLEGRIAQLRVSDANRQIQTQTKVVMLLREQFELAQIEAKKAQQFFLVIDPPLTPKNPAGPRKAMNTILAFLVSLLVGSIAGMAISLVRRELKRGPRTS